MTREWAFRYYALVWTGAALFFIPLILAMFKSYKRWWIREMNRNNEDNQNDRDRRR